VGKLTKGHFFVPIFVTTRISSMTEQFKPDVAFEDFEKLDLRIATVLDAVPVEGTDKLMLLTISLGRDEFTRKIVAGIKQHYKPDQLIGQHILIVANLAPRKIRGIESHGMVLAGSFMVENAESPSLCLLQPNIQSPSSIAGTAVH
jgi:methionine--tRNA ligase beta chain